MERLPLFVFGTLRSGQCNHDRIRGRYDRIQQARLFGYTRTGPLTIAPREAGCVLGELFFLAEGHYENVLANCDELEMLLPGETTGKWYQRKAVTVSTCDGEVMAWAYVSPD